jgi:hypothetical protein
MPGFTSPTHYAWPVTSPGPKRRAAGLFGYWRATAFVDPGPLQEWRVFDLEASLRREQRRWDEALRLHDLAMATAPQKDQSRILLKKAMTLEQSGAHEHAIEILTGGV